MYRRSGGGFKWVTRCYIYNKRRLQGWGSYFLRVICVEKIFFAPCQGDRVLLALRWWRYLVVCKYAHSPNSYPIIILYIFYEKKVLYSQLININIICSSWSVSVLVRWLGGAQMISRRSHMDKTNRIIY